MNIWNKIILKFRSIIYVKRALRETGPCGWRITTSPGSGALLPSLISKKVTVTVLKTPYYSLVWLYVHYWTGLRVQLNCWLADNLRHKTLSCHYQIPREYHSFHLVPKTLSLTTVMSLIRRQRLSLWYLQATVFTCQSMGIGVYLILSAARALSRSHTMRR